VLHIRMTPVASRRSWLAPAALAVALPWLAGAASNPPPAAVTTLMQRDLPDLPGKEALLLTVEYLPGGASLPHRHDADVLGYVLTGEVVTQLAGHDPVTLHAGETFYEGPQDIHVRSANPDSRVPAKLLVFMVKDRGRPVSRPAQASQEDAR
jgi:quercetin dioxygenase-like cupin family protein